MVKSWTLTLWRFTKPMPVMVRWSVRLAYALPLMFLVLGLLLLPHPGIVAIGFFIGIIWFVRPAIRSWLRHYSVAQVAKRRRRGPWNRKHASGLM